jgi:hypothetical protein
MCNEKHHNTVYYYYIIIIIVVTMMRSRGLVTRVCSPPRIGLRHLQNISGKSEGKGPLTKPRRKWKDTVKINLQHIGGVGVDGIHLPQGRVQ